VAAALIAAAPAAPAQDRRLDYDVALSGVTDTALRDLLNATSRLQSLKDNPPFTVAGLEQRIDDDRPRLDEALRSEGYYDARVDIAVDAGRQPATVRIAVEPGPVYRLAAYDVRYVGATAAGDLPRDPAVLGLAIGAPARAAAIVAAEETLFRELANRGHPFAQRRDRRLVVDHNKRTMTATIEVDPGPAARLGPARFEGAENVEGGYLQRLVPWRAGDRFDRRRLDELATRLRATALFQSAQVEPAGAPGPDGTVPVTVRLREAPPRSFGGGLAYSTSEGIAATAFWEHRNLLGRQEKLRFEAEAGQQVQRLSGALTAPNVGRYGQDVHASQVIDNQDTDAFEGLLATTQAGVERTFGRRLKGSVYGLFEYSSITDEEGERDFALLGLPLAVTWDARDDILDPTRGVRVRAETTPFVGILFEDAMFLRTELSASTYWAPFGGNAVVLAGRARLGSIAGDATGDIPANRRFYAGGGGSLRGFAYQKAGPLDADGDPLGGRSVVEVGAEARFRVFGDFGIVPFIEGGNVYDSSLPEFGGRYLWSAGLGLRYFTPIGPVRLDVAVPLNPRDEDDSFQFYVSLGQAF